MAGSKNTGLDAGLISRKGEARPGAQVGAAGGTVAVTVRLDVDRYKRLVTYAAGFAPRRKNQEIMVAALDAYLAAAAGED